MGYQSEEKLENQLLQQLKNQQYKYVKISNEKELIENFREQLNLFNEKRLDNKPLTYKEFERVLNYLNGKSVFESAKILRDKVPLERESGKKIHIEFFNTRQWCENNFQVTNQVTVIGKYTNRYDVTLLINGLPVVQIELKRRGLDFKEAFNQINRYRKHSYHGLYRYIQIFVISNGVDTKYYANGDRDPLFSYTFFWSDKENNRITNLSEFTSTFLERCHIAKVIARYMIINETDKALLVMRPYQIYAVEALIKRATETNNNGFIWHTTGSGKTITSFKASQILGDEPKVKKVFFLIDRKDLNTQTKDEFNKFEKDCVDDTDNTKVLVNQIDDPNKKLIVTTIQKMSNAIKNPKYKEMMIKFQNEKVIFIIDECHRSQFGDMHTAIKEYFHNAQYFGFTGTPLLKENKSQDGRATADLFEKCLHTYLIKDAIKDENVLGFSVEYIKTFKGEVDEGDDTKVEAIDTKEAFMNDKRIDLIANHIIKNHALKTRNMKYTSIFAVDGIPMLIKYYDKFKELEHNLKITAIYTYGQNEDSEGRDEHSRDSLERIISDYNKVFDTNYSTDTFNNYFKDVSNKVKSADIDILIVVNMFLTGFDSKKLNTLYVDKNLQYHSLLQAYSRTNRVENMATKPYGNIVCYRNLKENTDNAIRLFSDSSDVNTVLMGNFEEYLETFKEQLKNLFNIAKTPEAVDLLEREEDKKSFIIIFRELSKVLAKLNTFTEFEFTESKVGISEQTYQDYKSKYFLIHDSIKNQENKKESILSDIDFELELMHTDKINVSYIMDLIRNIDREDSNKRERDIKNILNKLNNADNQELRLKVDLIKEFLEKVIPTISKDQSIDDAYNNFEDMRAKKEIEEFSSEISVDPKEIEGYVYEYEFSGIINHKELNDSIKAPLLKRKKIVEKIKEFVTDHVSKYE